MEDVPIPREGIYWGVEAKLPPDVDENERYVILDPNIPDDDTEVDAEIVRFQSRCQAVLSVWLMGFSYQQMLVLFPSFQKMMNIRNFVFPRSAIVASAIRTNAQTDSCYPRQIVDSEWINLVRAVGLPNGKISSATYSRYMKWLDSQEPPFWIKNKTPTSIKINKLKDSVERKKKKIEELGKEVEKLESDILQLEENLY